MMAGIVESVELMLKWRDARRSVHRLFTALDREGGEAKFTDRMKLLQGYIKACMAKHNLEMVPAIIHLGNECCDDGVLAVQVLAAGYDLTEGKDYTIEQNETVGEIKDSPEPVEG